MKGPTKLRYYSLLCKHKSISVLEARVMLRVAKDAIEKENPTFELIDVCCANIRHLKANKILTPLKKLDIGFSFIIVEGYDIQIK